MSRKFWLFLLSLFLFGSAVFPLHADTHRLSKEAKQKRDDGPIYASAGAPQSRFRNKVGHVSGLDSKLKVWKDLAKYPEGTPEFNAAVYKKMHGLYNLPYTPESDTSKISTRFLNDLGYLSDAHPDSVRLKAALDKYKSDLNSNDLKTRFELGKRFMEAGKTNKNFYIGALEQFEWIGKEYGSKPKYKLRDQIYDFLDDLIVYFYETNQRTHQIRTIMTEYRLFPNRGPARRAIKELNIPFPEIK